MNDSLGKKLDLLLYTGGLLIQCLADSNRIDRNMRRAAISMGIPADKFNMHITYTSLILNISDGGNSVTKIRKIRNHHPDMNVLTHISTLTWRAVQDSEFTIEDYEREINAIGKLGRVYPQWLSIIAAGAACACFAKLFGADIPAMVITALASSTAFFLRRILAARHFNVYMAVAVSAFTASLIAIVGINTGLSSTPNHPLIATVLFLIPGVPLINSVDDLIDGYTMVGVTRATTATLIIGAISFGMLIAMWILSFNSYEIATRAQGGAFIALAAACASIGFGILFNVPQKALIVCALGGALAVTVRNLLIIYAGVGLPLASFAGAVCVGIAMMYLIHIAHVPPNVISIPSVIPMIPGVVMYDAMIGLIHLSTTTDYQQAEMLTITVQSGVTAFLTILAVSLGITLPNIVNRKYFSRKEHLYRKKSI